MGEALARFLSHMIIFLSIVLSGKSFIQLKGVAVQATITAMLIMMLLLQSQMTISSRSQIFPPATLILHGHGSIDSETKICS
jgi:putative effector of murein hydrolase LrgA (UPF0299 family)